MYNMAKQIEAISIRLRKAMDLRGLKQVDLVTRTNLPKSSISQYLSGVREPKQKAIYLLSEVLAVEPGWLMGYDVPMEAKRRPISAQPVMDSCRIPLLGRVAAGKPLFDEGNVIGEVLVDPKLVAGESDLYALKVRGDSMSPKILDGDTLIVREQSTADDGEIVIVTVNGDEGTCKKLKRYPDALALVSINPLYEPIMYTWEEVEQLPVRIVGKVLQSRHDF